MSDPSAWFLQALTGVTFGLILFLVASGLSLIFGVMRILNFAHGTFYMLGAYGAYTVTREFGTSTTGFWLALVIAPLCVAGLGVLVEAFLLRRVYSRPPAEQLLLTFALVLIGADVVRRFWGAEFRSVSGPSLFDGSVSLFGRSFPSYYFFVWAMAGLVGLALSQFLQRTRLGLIVRATVQDREMTGALGVNVPLIYTGMFGLATWLAGVSGVLVAPLVSLQVDMAADLVLQAFIIVVIGGLGSIAGAFVGALLLGMLNSFGILVSPRFAIIFPFLLMAIVLLIRPHGLLGREEMEEE